MAYGYRVQGFSWMLALLIATGGSLGRAQAQNEEIGEKVYQRTLKATVWIMGAKGGWGSGSLIDATQRLVITNYHVVKDAGNVTVFFPIFRNGKLVTERSEYLTNARYSHAIPGEVLHKDPKRDLAIVKLAIVPKDAKVLHLAPKSPSPAQRVHSIGNPGVSGGLWIYTSGTVRQVYHKRWRAKDRERTYDLEAEVVETQSPTNPGDSGGPLVNDRGELVGVTEGTTRDAQLVSLFIDVTEVRSFLKSKGVRLKSSAVVARNDSEEKPSAEATTANATEEAERKATTKLNFAKTLADDGKLEKAKDRCEEILKSYPNTKAAEEARSLLDKLSK
jgi:S1-C subfamily serine protease